MVLLVVTVISVVPRELEVSVGPMMPEIPVVLVVPVISVVSVDLALITGVVDGDFSCISVSVRDVGFKTAGCATGTFVDGCERLLIGLYRAIRVGQVRFS